MNRRIWELDAFRGLCILGMVIVHLIYDLVELYGILDWIYPVWFSAVKDRGGVLFLLLSGICATLGHRSGRRGLIVFLCGMLCTAVTAGLYVLNLSDRSIIIYFGVLHCLGICMLLWVPLKRLPTWCLAFMGTLFIGVGFAVHSVRVCLPWLFPLGLVTPTFVSSDFFPLLPHLGFFLLGAVIGRTVYRRKQTLFPRISETVPGVRLLCLCGRQSLLIYLLHQPVLSVLCLAISALC